MGFPVCVKQQCFDARVKYRGSRQGGCSKREAQQGQHQRDFFKKTLKKTLPMKLSAACSDVFLTELARNAPSVHCVANPATAHSFRTTGRAFCCSRAIGIRFESTGTLLALPSGRQCCNCRSLPPPAGAKASSSILFASCLPTCPQLHCGGFRLSAGAPNLGQSWVLPCRPSRRSRSCSAASATRTCLPRMALR